MAEHKRGRPPKSDADKLQPVTTNLCRADYEALCARARDQREEVSVVLRNMARKQLHNASG